MAMGGLWQCAERVSSIHETMKLRDGSFFTHIPAYMSALIPFKPYSNSTMKVNKLNLREHRFPLHFRGYGTNSPPEPQEQHKLPFYEEPSCTSLAFE
jgi:hypothetical protein